MIRNDGRPTIADPRSEVLLAQILGQPHPRVQKLQRQSQALYEALLNEFGLRDGEPPEALDRAFDLVDGLLEALQARA